MDFLRWLLKLFVSRITETSTWIGTISLVLFILGLKSFLIVFLFGSIFVSEAWWDEVAKTKGEELKLWIDEKLK
jgi:hypothetical protein